MEDKNRNRIKTASSIKLWNFEDVYYLDDEDEILQKGENVEKKIHLTSKNNRLKSVNFCKANRFLLTNTIEGFVHEAN